MEAYFNRGFVPYEEACLPLHDAGFVFGATVTDLCRTFHHRLFRLQDHVARFRQSCQLARIAQPIPDDQVAKLAEELNARNSKLLQPKDELVLVMFATPGPVAHYCGRDDAGDVSPTFGMHTFQLPFSRYASLFHRGARLISMKGTVSLPNPQIKHRSRLNSWITGHIAQQTLGGSWALLLDSDGYVAETAVANFLIVKDGKVISPPRASILNGISLLTVEEICREIQIPVQEQPLTLKDCQEADEALLTGTSFCIAGVGQLNDVLIPWPGQVFEKLLEAWNQRVGLDIRAQILSRG
jgi:branched-subunit amino acid aminotransferase/4-amino-4-deoxychorismate lyase